MDVEYDDPIWEFILKERLKPYIPKVREWWSKSTELQPAEVGIYPLTNDPPGLMWRMTRTGARSTIKGVQAFPFVPVPYLQIKGVTGGVNKMVERVCSKGITMDEFTVVERHNLCSTYGQGRILIFVPTDILAGSRRMGKYVYLTQEEMLALKQDIILTSVKHKMESVEAAVEDE